MRSPNTKPIATLALPGGATFSVWNRCLAYAYEIRSRCPEFKVSREDKFEGEVTDGAGNLLGGPWSFISVAQALAWAKRATREDLEDEVPA